MRYVLLRVKIRILVSNGSYVCFADGNAIIVIILVRSYICYTFSIIYRESFYYIWKFTDSMKSTH